MTLICKKARSSQREQSKITNKFTHFCQNAYKYNAKLHKVFPLFCPTPRISSNYYLSLAQRYYAPQTTQFSWVMRRVYEKGR